MSGDGLAIDRTGNAWVTGDFCDFCSGPVASDIYRLTPTGQVNHFPFVASDLVTGPDGKVWFVDQSNSGNGRQRIGSLSASGRYESHQVPRNTYGGSLRMVNSGPGSRLFFRSASAAVTNTIGMITTSGSFSTIHLPNDVNADEAISLGRDGNLWFENTSASGLRLEVERLSLG